MLPRWAIGLGVAAILFGVQAASALAAVPGLGHAPGGGC
jgi:hypothetical protein